MELTAKRDDLLLQLYDNKGSKKYLERKVSEKEVVLKAMTVSAKQLEKMVCSLRNDTKFLQKTNDELLRRQVEQETIVRRRVTKLVKSVATRSVGMALCISRAISKCCFTRGI